MVAGRQPTGIHREEREQEEEGMRRRGVGRQ